MGTRRIRLATPDDAGAIAAIYAPFVRDSAISFEWEPPTVDEMRGRIEQTLARFPWLVAIDDDGVIGYAYATSYRTRAAYQWSAEVSVYVDPRAHRRGAASALYDALIALLRLQGYRTLYGVIALPNEASVSFHERKGFEKIGVFRAAGFKHGAWHDVLWMRRGLEQSDAEPEPPIPLPALDPSAVEAVLIRAESA
jgi:L-amino acid N-acyltransferase YncA